MQPVIKKKKRGKKKTFFTVDFTHLQLPYLPLVSPCDSGDKPLRENIPFSYLVSTTQEHSQLSRRDTTEGDGTQR